MTHSTTSGRSARARLPLAGLFLAACVAGCASAGAGGDGAPRSSRNVITVEELAPLQQLSALEVVQRLRPAWLRVRGGGLPQLIVDGTPMEGGTETLRTFRVGEIKELRYLDPGDATMRFGTGYPAGAIVVLTGR